MKYPRVFRLVGFFIGCADQSDQRPSDVSGRGRRVSKADSRKYSKRGDASATTLMSPFLDDVISGRRQSETFISIGEGDAPIHSSGICSHTRSRSDFAITLADGRTNCGEAYTPNRYRTNTFYVPRDIADEPRLKAAVSAGYNTGWATSIAALLSPVSNAFTECAHAGGNNSWTPNPGSSRSPR